MLDDSPPSLFVSNLNFVSLGKISRSSSMEWMKFLLICVQIFPSHQICKQRVCESKELNRDFILKKRSVRKIQTVRHQPKKAHYKVSLPTALNSHESLAGFRHGRKSLAWRPSVVAQRRPCHFFPADNGSALLTKKLKFYWFWVWKTRCAFYSTVFWGGFSIVRPASADVQPRLRYWESTINSSEFFPSCLRIRAAMNLRKYFLTLRKQGVHFIDHAQAFSGCSTVKLAQAWHWVLKEETFNKKRKFDDQCGVSILQ